MKWDNEQRFGDFALDTCIVYGWFRGETCLYIGMSTCGLSRPLASGHHVIGKASPLRAKDKLRWSTYPHEPAARLMENYLIRQYEPRFNRQDSKVIEARKINATSVTDAWSDPYDLEAVVVYPSVQLLPKLPDVATAVADSPNPVATEES